MTPVSIIFWATLAAAAVTNTGLNAARDELARDLDAVSDGVSLFARDEENTTLQPFSLAASPEDEEKNGVTTRDFDEADHFGELVARKADGTDGGEKENNGKGKDADGKKNTENNCKCEKGKNRGKDAEGKSCRCRKRKNKNKGKHNGNPSNNNNGTVPDHGKKHKGGGDKAKIKENGGETNGASGSGPAVA